ncbi:MAG: alpha-L-rhamnosidase, partial [Bacteroidales bacterium]|nr:alpha-L-rhamnosidase [Bacteroidales bacterium]
MTDLLKKPEDAVITNPEPRFSWIVNGESDATMQTAYQILVASDKQTIEENEGDVWDSGKVSSEESVAVPFRGKKLEEYTSYWWKVRTWDQDGQTSAYSGAQQFNTGDFSRVDRNWPGQSRWVTIEENGEERHVLEDRQRANYHEITPESVTKNAEGNHFISFAKAAFGTLKLNLDPQRADSVVVHLGEKSTGCNGVDRSPGGSIVYEKHVLDLDEGQTEYKLELPRKIAHYPNSQVLPDHMPEVTSYRYVEIEGYEGSIDKEEINQLVLLYPFDGESSYFHSSDSNLNKIWELCKHTLQVTPFFGLYVDNGARERMPYEADAYMQQISHYSVDREYAVQRYTTKYLIFNPSWPVEWHLHIPLMAWADYMQTANKALLEEYYDEIKHKAMLPLAREDGLLSTPYTREGYVDEEFLETIHYDGSSFRDITDWPQGTPANESEHRSGHGSITLEGETDRFVFSDVSTVVNAFHYRNLVLISKIAGVLDKEEDARWFEERAKKVKASFNEKLFNEDRGLYTDGDDIKHTSLHANMFPVAFGLAPKSSYPQLREFLISKGMACSPIMARYLFDALYELEAENYALRLLTNELDRSWMNMIRFGTTIVSEAWDIKYKRNMTWNQPTGATPAYIIPRKIFGIEPLEPSFRKIRIKPQPGDLEQAEIKHPTI